MEARIVAIFDNRHKKISEKEKAVIKKVISHLDTGKLRVAEKIGDEWHTHAWVQKAILLYFMVQNKRPMHAGPFEYIDKIPLKKNIRQLNIRVVPPATIRYGSFIKDGAILMPSYINIGAHVGKNTMVDTWATVGSGAQIGSNVHLSGGVGIGGVLEPPGSRPVIIEDNVFVGSRSIIVEGALIEEGAVIAAQVSITGSTKIIDVTQSSPKIYKGRVPKNSVVIPGSYAKEFPAGTYNVQCALIIGVRIPSTDAKTALNQFIRTSP